MAGPGAGAGGALGIVRGMLGSWGGGAGVASKQGEIRALETELSTLDSLYKALQIELGELRTERARALESRTLMGFLKNAMGYGMSVYCVYRCGVSRGVLRRMWTSRKVRFESNHPLPAGCIQASSA